MFSQPEKMLSSKIFLGFMSLVLFFYILFIGAEYIVPFVVALLFSFLIVWLQSFYKQFVKNDIVALLLSVVSYFFFFWIIGQIINSNIKEIITLWPVYKEKFSAIINVVVNFFGLSEKVSLENILGLVDISLVSNLVSGISISLKNTGIILIYTFFLLWEFRFFGNKMDIIFPKQTQRRKILQIVDEIKGDLKIYFLIRTILSLLTGIFSYFVMLAFGLDFALFWGFIAFVFNFIPAIGSIIAVGFPIIFSIVQFDSIYMTLALLLILMGTQFCFGNLIEPKLLGNRLNLSPIIIILALGFWAIIWGFVGMLLCVPIMVILNSVLAKFESTRPIAILFSEKGIVRADFELLEAHKKKVIEKIKEKFKKKKK